MEVTKQMSVKYNLTSKLSLGGWKAKLAEAGLAIAAYGNKVELVHKSDKKVLATKTVPNHMIGGACSGKEPALGKLSVLVVNWLDDVFQKGYVPQEEGEAAAAGDTLVQNFEGEKEYVEAKTADTDDTATKPGSEYRFAYRAPTNDDFSGDRVPMAHAVRMYQPVRGTDGSSTYFVIGMGRNGPQRIVVAARYKSATALSIRVEGSVLELSSHSDVRVYRATRMKKKEKDPGHPTKVEGWTSYASAHLNVSQMGDEAQEQNVGVTRSLTGILGALAEEFGVEWETPIPSGKDLWKKGV